MKIADENNREDNKFVSWIKEHKKGVIIGSVISVVIIAVFVCLSLVNTKGFFVNSSEDVLYEDGRGNNESMVSTETETETEDLDPDKEENPGVMPVKEGKGTVKNVTTYTGIKTNTDDLVQLVKDTITHGREHIDENLKAESDAGFSALSKVIATIEWADSTNDAAKDVDAKFDYDAAFAEEDGSVTSIVDDANTELNTTLTYNHICGSIGTAIFDDVEIGMFDTTQCALLNFVRSGVYNFDVNKMNSFYVDATNNRVFVDGNDMKWQINFGVDFTYENKVYEALITNMDGKYKVIDILDSDDAQAEIIKYENVTIDKAQDPVGPGMNGGTGSDGLSNDVVIGDGGIKDPVIDEGNSNNNSNGDVNNGGNNSGLEDATDWNNSIGDYGPLGGNIYGESIESGEKVPGAN